MGQDGEPVPVRHVHLAACVAQSLSEDGSEGGFRFVDREGDSVLVTVDAKGLMSLRTAAASVHNEFVHRNNSYSFDRPRSFGVVDSPNERGRTVLAFNPHQSNEAVFVLDDESALELARQLEERALSHMTPEQRAARLKKPLLNSAGIIIPRN